MALPKIALTVGDPAGIGPEIVAKAAADPSVRAVCEPIVFAPPADPSIRPGEVSAAAGRAAYDTIVRAVEAAKRGDVDAVATAPVNKLAFSRAGLEWKGHTDLLAHLCGDAKVAMMFHSPQLKVVLITVHVPLVEVSAKITPELVDETLSMRWRCLASRVRGSCWRASIRMRVRAGSSARKTIACWRRPWNVPALEA